MGAFPVRTDAYDSDVVSDFSDGEADGARTRGSVRKIERSRGDAGGALRAGDVEAGTAESAVPWVGGCAT